MFLPDRSDPLLQGNPMKKLLAAFAVLAASSMAQAQTLAAHPDARNDRAQIVEVADHGPRAYRRADHRRARHHHRKHHRTHHRG